MSPPLGSRSVPLGATSVTFSRVPKHWVALFEPVWRIPGVPSSIFPERKCTVAKGTQVSLVDDLDGSQAAGTVGFAPDGKVYELDLSDANASRLRDALAPFVA